MKRGTSVNTHDLCRLLKLMLGGLIIIMIVILLFPVEAPGRPLLLLLLVATTSSATVLLTKSFNATLDLLFVSCLVLSPLLLHQQLNLAAILEVVALGTVNLAVLLVGAH